MDDVKKQKIFELESGIKAFVRRLINDFGLEKTDGTEIDRITQIIIKKYGDFWVKDIGHAFELALLHDLSELTADDYRLYGKLTPEFVVKVLNSYRKHNLIPKKEEERNKVCLENSKLKKEIEDKRLRYDSINYALEQYTSYILNGESHIFEDFRYFIYNLFDELNILENKDEKTLKELHDKYTEDVIAELRNERGRNAIAGDNLAATSIGHIIDNVARKHIAGEKNTSFYNDVDVKITSRIRHALVKNAFIKLASENISPAQLKNMLLITLNKEV